ncbi:MAG: hypothetical protein C4575_04480 [Desulforudis sp.]|jgi:hypothetical protein|nr:MAG: hypothetical protein C4575_04480 [Desulforudis sp.]
MNSYYGSRQPFVGRKTTAVQRFRYVFLGIAAILAAIVAAFEQYGTLTTTQADYALLIFVLGLFPAFVGVTSHREIKLMPLMPLHGFFYALTFGLPTFSAKTEWRSNSASLDDALMLTLGGLFVLYLGYYFSRPLFAKIKPIEFLSGVPDSIQRRSAWILLVLYLLFILAPVIMKIPSVGQLTAPLGYVSTGLLLTLSLDGRLSRQQFIVFTCVLVFILLDRTLTGSLAHTGAYLIFFGIILWQKRHVLPKKLIAATVIFIFIFNPVKFKYREYTWWSPQGSEISYTDKISLFYEATIDTYTGGSFFDYVSSDPGTVNRLAHIATFAYVINLTPRVVPYWMGGSYETLWTSFIPRILWPGKPVGTIGNIFGKRYYLLNQQDSSTSFNLPWLIEFYANFGIMGVFLGMFGVGLLFRFLVQKFSVDPSRRIEYVLGISIIFSLWYAESNFSLMAGGILLTYFSFVILLKLLPALSRKRTF